MARRLFVFVPILALSLAMFSGCGGSGTPSETCTDSVQNQNETDVDCGGVCSGCADGKKCLVGSDCAGGTCSNGTCASTAATCSDNTKNQDETDVDCGGNTCDPCANGDDCLDNGDCSSGNCDNGTCAAGTGTCSDNTQNQDETDVDCGGDTCGPCADGKMCGVNGDCSSGNCDNGTCAAGAATCNDNTQNQDETDVDCGGLICSACADGDHCVIDDDCVSLNCNAGTCEAMPAHCTDNAVSGDESDVDCGGECPPCADGMLCNSDADCTSDWCDNGTCAALADHCTDNAVSGDESDVDCGGECPPCANGLNCNGNPDCESSVCDNGTCTGDACPNDPDKTEPGICGCGVPDTDTDGDGTADCIDNCPNDVNKTEPGVCGCGTPDTDTDGDGTADCNDGCPNDPNKIDAGQCGCGTPDTDSDGDGTADCNDGCPNDPNKIAAGQCGCGNADTDTDGDGTADCNDGCPNDANKTEPGVCGCGTPDTDSDGDGTPNCFDQCPNDPNKIAPGVCGCGNPDVDSDGDGVLDCLDGCPADPNKTAPGGCGCGVPDVDSDGDGSLDCNDSCPLDPTDNCFCYSITYDGCPTGASVWCNGQPLDHYSSAQAQIACQTCFGQACVLESGDCAGGGWWVNDASVNPDRVAFGYADGCSGTTGRIWYNGSSYIYFGYWAAPYYHEHTADNCPTRATGWWDDISHAEPFQQKQAEYGCEACLGRECALSNGDCAGAAYNVNNDPVNPDRISFGYAEGCSGDAGRIWRMGNSYTSYGNWASYPADTAVAGATHGDEATLLDTRMGLIWDSYTSHFWSVSGGGPTGVREAQQNPDGSLVATYQPGIDFRAIMYNDRAYLRVLTRGISTNVIQYQSTPGVFSNLVTLSGGAIDAQANVAWDWQREQYVTMNEGTINRWAADGTFVGTITLSGWNTDNAGEDAYPQNRGIQVSDTGYYLTYYNGIVSVFNEAGQRIWMITLPGAGTSFDSYFSFSYADGKAWVLTNVTQTWRSYDIGL